MALSKIETQALDVGQIGGRRNLIINGAMQVWQRGTSFTDLATEAFSADRWKIDYRPNGNINAAQQDYVSYKALRFTNAYTGSQSFNFEHKVEDVTFFSGKEVTLSFYAKASEAFTMGIAAYENYGSGGSAQTTAVSSSKSITTTRQQFTVTFTCTDMSAKTVGSSNCMRLNFSNPLSQDAWVEIDHVQLEVGSVATPFEHRSYGEELLACYRYYYKLFPELQDSYCSGSIYAYSTSNAVGNGMFPVKMRVAPTAIDLSAATDWNLNKLAGYNRNVTGLTWGNTTNTQFYNLNYACSSNDLTSGVIHYLKSANANAYIAWSAEL